MLNGPNIKLFVIFVMFKMISKIGYTKKGTKLFTVEYELWRIKTLYVITSRSTEEIELLTTSSISASPRAAGIY